MKSRRRNVSEDGLTISRRNTRSKKPSIKARENSEEPIPIDLVIEILLRLPTKSIAICRCVSKLWGSIIRRQYFTDLFLKMSSARPQLLFSWKTNCELLFFSSPQVQNPDEKSSLVAANYHMKFDFDGSFGICGRVRGLVCITYLRIVKGRKEIVPVICNPSTGQSLPLPKVKTRKVRMNSFFGFDPIDKQFKVLSMTSSIFGRDVVSKEHQVLTLGTQKLSWRMIECDIPHDPISNGICINGGLYYQALVDDEVSEGSKIVWFDVRSEKFRLINKAEEMVTRNRDSTLVNYKGRLGALMTDGVNLVTEQSRCFELWVLVDAEKHEWLKHIYVLPSLWKNVVAEAKLSFVGVTNTNEIVLRPRYGSGNFYVVYYNIERRTISRVEIQGLDAGKNRIPEIEITLDHVENVELMKAF